MTGFTNPKDAHEVEADIASMDAGRSPLSGKLALARLAIRFGNITDDGKALYRQYLERHGETPPVPVCGPST